MDIISYALSKKGMQQSVSDYLDEHLTNPTNPPIDTSLEIAGAAADSKATGDKLSELKEDLSDIESSLTLPTETLTPKFITGSYIVTNGSVGSTVDIIPVANSGFAYIIVPCKKTDVFTVTANGGTRPKAWCLTDKDYKKLSVATSNTVTDATVKPEQDGYLIVNSTTAVQYSLVRNGIYYIDEIDERVGILEEEFNEITGKITHITDPHLLFWKMGTFGSGGPQTGTFTDRMYTVCKVKKGSKVVATSSGGVKINFGYKLSESDTGLSGFKTFNYQTIVIDQDCIMYLGVVNFPTAQYLKNDSLLDNVAFDLYVVDFETKYRKDRAFGSVPFGHYEGQHTDTTGWNNNTSDIDAIYSAFDSLVTESNGWLTKKDLGVAYDTYHMFQYDTVPVGLHAGSDGINIPKVAIVCCEHGNEKMSAYAMHYLMFDLIHNPSKNPILYYLRSNCAISFVPIANPWGFINKSRLNENGVNLNRNFPTYNWDEYSDETSDVGGINYKGTAPASETQTQLIIQFLRNNFDAVFAIDLHTNGENTSAWYEVSTAILNADASADSPNYDVQKSYYIPSKLNTNYIKSWMDENYGSNLGNVFYGNVTFPEVDRPTTGQWIRESNNMVGITYEILCGSADGYLGQNLTKYSPSTIKASAEELGDYLVAMIANSKEVTG